MSCTKEDFSYDTQCHFACNPGYKLVGSKSQACLAFAAWSGIPPKCRGLYLCSKYSVLYNLHATTVLWVSWVSRHPEFSIVLFDSSTVLIWTFQFFFLQIGRVSVFYCLIIMKFSSLLNILLTFQQINITVRKLNCRRIMLSGHPQWKRPWFYSRMWTNHSKVWPLVATNCLRLLIK